MRSGFRPPASKCESVRDLGADRRGKLLKGHEHESFRAHAAQREAALIKTARVKAEKAQAEARLSSAPAPSREPEPVRWWLDYLKAPRS